MKLIVQSPKKVVIEVETSKIENVGFFDVWDEIRDYFPKSEYNLFSIDNNYSDDSIFIELFKMQESSNDYVKQKVI